MKSQEDRSLGNFPYKTNSFCYSLGPVTPELTKDFAKQVRDIALTAGEEILRVAQAPITASKKDDQSPVTAADHVANQLIVARLAQLTPTVAIVSEEGDQVLDNPDRPFWLVDPLDGTKEFIAGNGEYTVNIALIEQRRPVLGVIHTPTQRRTYFSFGRNKAFRQDDDGNVVPITSRPVNAQKVTAAISRSHLDKTTQQYLEQQGVTATRQMGSSIKFCLIAEGDADIYPRFGPTMEWDTAAGHAILIAAGGDVTTTDGSALIYAKPGFRNPGFIARGLSSV